MTAFGTMQTSPGTMYNFGYGAITGHYFGGNDIVCASLFAALIRQALFPSRNAAKDSALPSGVRGSVDNPPWFRYRSFDSALA